MSRFRSASSAKRFVDVYFFDQTFLVVPVNQTTVGMGIDGDPIETLPIQESDEKLGRSILESFRKTKVNVPSPVVFEMEPHSLLKSASAPNWKFFFEEATHCLLEMNKDGVVVYPSKKEAESFLNEGEKVELEPNVAIIGRVVRQVLLGEE